MPERFVDEITLGNGVERHRELLLLGSRNYADRNGPNSNTSICCGLVVDTKFLHCLCINVEMIETRVVIMFLQGSAITQTVLDRLLDLLQVY